MSDREPRVSVVMCTFNGVRFLDAQCDSVLRQTVLPHEVVVADDGSTDGTPELLLKWADAWRQRGIGVTLLPSQAGHGVRANFERALAAATGDVIVLSDQDDEWLDDRIERSVAALARPGVHAYFADAQLIDGKSQPLGGTLFGALPLHARERDAFAAGHGLDALLHRNVATGATMAVSRRVVDAALPIPEPWIHDEWLVAIAAALTHGSEGVVLDSSPVIRYRLHGANAIGVETSRSARLKRLTERRGDRLEKLSRRADALAAWVREQDLGDDVRRSVEGKAAFERRRAAYPSNRIGRVPRVLANARGYGRYASQGFADIARDLLQRR